MILPLVAGATTLPGGRGHNRINYEETAFQSFIVPPLSGGEGGAVSHQRGESHRRRLIDVMLIMSYDTESKSHNADFILIARKGDTTTL